MPVNQRLVDDLLGRLSSVDQIATDPFAVASDLCRLVSQDSDAAETHELVLRAMEYREAFGDSTVILDGLLRQIGLFPYLDPNTLSLGDAIALEAHRPSDMGDQIVFHRAQGHVYRLLLEGENVALSAPTSFGKSLIIDAMIASGKYSNIVIVVPTLALIDETRRRLAERFRDSYKINTHPSQTRGKKTVFVLTQERVLEVENWSFVDFFVIDEFYKLAPQREDDDRAGLLNQAFYSLVKSGAQFYMLGPNISGVTEQNHLRIALKFIKEPHYHTVATQVHRMKTGSDNLESLVDLCKTLDMPTIIFCRSPSRASEVARRLVFEGLGERKANLAEASDWIGRHFHPEWHFRETLEMGIGVHHGRIPRSLAQFVVRKFNDGDIRFLVCTSTLIEGVNTKARNIIVYDNRINREQIDLFTFNNIKGRSGRMFEYFVGHVYVFHPDPQTELPFIDVPVLSQSTDASDSLIVQMDEDDLTEESRNRRARFLNQSSLSFEVIRLNRGIDPDRQIAVAERIAAGSSQYKNQFAWSGSPSFDELRQMCELIYEEFDGRRLGGGSARSAMQLTMMIRNLRNRPATRELVEQQFQYSSSYDEAVTRVLDFLRMWATFHFPRFLRAVGNIQRDVLEREGRRSGNYDWFAGQVESLYSDPVLQSLEEYGIPFDTSRRLENRLATRGDLDASLDRLSQLDVTSLNLHDFEKELLDDAIRHL
ncbi:helicase [Blastopirellula marina]|uniref:Helicase n=1 Tax=Blastopirellula marina TaxID=124 RepID=A0A2S8F630_9BACT|nr:MULTISPECIES: DEAD/DEAH box helicase [Pirellulaceae]PQO27616.1 helicase [Blastopirellula marina]RCS48153.1 helicase [Bremerella cremea]